jgi:hypothetical protein
VQQDPSLDGALAAHVIDEEGLKISELLCAAAAHALQLRRVDFNVTIDHSWRRSTGGIKGLPRRSARLQWFSLHTIAVFKRLLLTCAAKRRLALLFPASLCAWRRGVAGCACLG